MCAHVEVGAEALAEVIAAETPAETGENMSDLRAELMGKLGEHADLLDDEEGTIRNLNALDAAGLQALLDKVNARLAEKSAGETATGDFVTPNGTIFEGMRVPTSEMSTTAPVETVVDGDTAPAETVADGEAAVAEVADGDAAVAEVAAEDNAALIAEAEQVSPGLFERIKAAFKEPGFLKRIFSKGSIRKAVDGWLANRRSSYCRSSSC